MGAQDLNSDIASLQAEIRQDDGTAISPLFNVTNSDMPIAMLGLINQQHYSITVYSCNGAGLCDSLSSDGFVYINNVGIDENATEAIRLYPNPTTEKIAIELTRKTSYRLIGTDGRLISEGEFAEGLNWLDLSKLNNGTYELIVGNKAYSIVKQ